MRYMLLIYDDETQAAGASAEQMQQVMSDYLAFGERHKDPIAGGDALMPTNSATTVRLREGKTLTTDGPFAETKEQLGGFYLVNCANLDEAIEIASHIPGAAWGSIEVRPVMEFEGYSERSCFPLPPQRGRGWGRGLCSRSRRPSSAHSASSRGRCWPR